MEHHPHEHSSTTGHDDSHHVDQHVKLYVGVFIALLALTGITVWLSFVNLGSSMMNMVVAMIVATIKGSLVALIFMHLKSERWTIYRFLLITAFFACGLFFLFALAFHDPIRLN